MSEQEPLLPTQNDTDTDTEPPSTLAHYRERSALVLESQRLHQTVIALVRTTPTDTKPIFPKPPPHRLS
jgi:hypothetical protein